MRPASYSAHPLLISWWSVNKVTGHRIQSGLVPAIQKSRLRLLGRALDPGVENVYTWLRGGVLNGEADLDQQWLDGTVEHESMGTRHDNRALAARLADFLQVAYRQYQSTLWKYPPGSPCGTGAAAWLALKRETSVPAHSAPKVELSSGLRLIYASGFPYAKPGDLRKAMQGARIRTSAVRDIRWISRQVVQLLVDADYVSAFTRIITSLDATIVKSLARLADFLQVAYRQYQSTLWKYHRDRLVEVD
ncbi:hypothetical protein BASA81_017348 [Batrachochytrium salamandrivorans]|nr:hypothetical protein BASA81_017348 [Batrachochytrium salamandrivorans]